MSMMTVKELKEELSKFPDDAALYPYEGEIIGIIIVEARKTTMPNGGVIHKPLGEILCELE